MSRLQKNTMGTFAALQKSSELWYWEACAVSRTYARIHYWAENAHTREFLKEKFQIEHIPCYYWMLVLLKMVKTDTLNQCLTRWAAQFLPEDMRTPLCKITSTGEIEQRFRLN